MTPNEMVLSLSKNECLKQPIQIILSPNQKLLSEFFSTFRKSTQNLEYFEKQDKPKRLFVPQIKDYRKLGYLSA